MEKIKWHEVEAGKVGGGGKTGGGSTGGGSTGGGSTGGGSTGGGSTGGRGRSSGGSWRWRKIIRYTKFCNIEADQVPVVPAQVSTR